jgi:hypothetical protein
MSPDGTFVEKGPESPPRTAEPAIINEKKLTEQKKRLSY